MLVSVQATAVQVTSVKERPISSTNKSEMDVNKPYIKYAKPLYYISLLAGITCPINFDRYTAKSGKLHKTYCVLMVALMLAASGISFYGKKSTVYEGFIQTVSITETISEVTLLISNLYAIINILFCGEKHMNTYFQLLQRIDTHLCTTINLRRKRFIFYTYLTLIHLAFGILCVYDFWTWTNVVDSTVWKYYALKLYSCYLNLLIVLQICTFASAIRLRFEILNERLFLVSGEWMKNMDPDKAIVLRDLFVSYKKDSGKVRLDGLDLKYLIQMHDLLCDLITLMNNAFGVNVVILVCNIIINSVIAFNLVLVFGIGAQGTYLNAWEHIIALGTLWAVIFITMAVVLARSCNAASQEAWRTATISYKLLACMPTNSCYAKERDIRAELEQLAMQVEHRRPAFDASGYSPINYSMLYTIIGAISSYLVIIIQFNNSPVLLDDKSIKTP